MTRPTDWSPLDIGSDPVPGDPIVVRQFATNYGDVADAIVKAANRLNALADHSDEYESKYVDEFRDKAKSVAKDISKAHERYAAVATAMHGYASPLEQAQTMSANALTKARHAQDAASSASTLHEHYTTVLKEPDLSEADREHYTQLANQAHSDAQGGSSALVAAKNDLQDAINLRDSAAGSAKDAISDIEGSGGLKDSWWDKFKNWVAEHAELMNTIVGWMNRIVAALSILAPFIAMLAPILSFIPIIGQIIDVLIIVAAVITVLNAVVQMAAGTEGVGKGLFDIGLAVIPFGAGKILGKAAEGAGEEATTMAATTLRTSKAAQGIKGVTQARALETVETAAKTAKPTIVQRLIADDPEALAKTQALAKMNLTTAGASSRVASSVASNSWKFGAYTRPLDYAVASGYADKGEEKLFPERESGDEG